MFTTTTFIKVIDRVEPYKMSAGTGDPYSSHYLSSSMPHWLSAVNVDPYSSHYLPSSMPHYFYTNI
jgi:hypothetical protein